MIRKTSWYTIKQFLSDKIVSQLEVTSTSDPILKLIVKYMYHPSKLGIGGVLLQVENKGISRNTETRHKKWLKNQIFLSELLKKAQTYFVNFYYLVF